MNKLNVLILATAAIIAAAWFANHRADQQFGLQSGELLIPGFADQLPQIDTVVITAAGDDTSTLKNVNGQWQVQERNGYVADVESVGKALRLLASASTLEAKTSQASNYAQLGVQDVDLTSDTTLRLQAFAGDTPVADVLIGKSGRGGNYVRLADQSQSWLIDQQINLPRRTADYLDRDVLKLPRNEVLKIAVTPLQGKPYSIERTEPGAGDFALIPAASKGKTTNVANVNRLAAALANLTISDVVAEAPSQLAWSSAQVTTSTGLILALELAKDEDAGQRYLKLSAKADPDYKQRLEAQQSGDTESDEAANDAPEQSIDAQLQAAQAQAETLDGLSRGRVFIAPQYTVDALMMSHDMLQKDAPKAD